MGVPSSQNPKRPHEHKDPIQTTIFGIPLIVGLGTRMWDLYVYICDLLGVPSSLAVNEPWGHEAQPRPEVEATCADPAAGSVILLEHLGSLGPQVYTCAYVCTDVYIYMHMCVYHMHICI